MNEDSPLIEQQVRHTTRLILNRPDSHNALNNVLIQQLRQALWRLAADSSVRQVLIAANGHKFCSGIDVDELRQLANTNSNDNIEDALQLGHLLRELDRFPKPVVALVQGEVYGGGVGLLACCDVVLASEKSRFCLPEVRLGFVPALASPYILSSIGRRNARRYMLTGEHFSAEEAKRIGLVHEVYPRENLALQASQLLKKLQAAAPSAQAEVKAMLARHQLPPIGKDELMANAKLIARLRSSPEGKEGIQAFLDNRRPAWRPTPSEEAAEDI